MHLVMNTLQAGMVANHFDAFVHNYLQNNVVYSV